MIRINFIAVFIIFLVLNSCLSGEIDMKTAEIKESEVIKIGLTASSSHNAQPWKIVKDDNVYSILSVEDRWLKEVDPDNRELLISMGVLIGTLDMASGFLGYDFNFTLIANDPMDPVIGTFTLKKNSDSVDIRGVNTLKSIYSEKAKYNRVNLELDLKSENINYYSIGSREFDWLRDSSIEANEQQAYRDNVQEELSNYFCFSKDDKIKGIGITPEMIRLPAIMLPIWYFTFNKDSVMSESFRKGTAPKVTSQIDNSSGFITLSSEDDSVKGLIDCGIEYQKLLYDLRGDDIEVHPISQILEEEPWMNQIINELELDKPVQMILRVGKYKKREISYETDTITSASIRAPFEAVYNN